MSVGGPGTRPSSTASSADGRASRAAAYSPLYVITLVEEAQRFEIFEEWADGALKFAIERDLLFKQFADVYVFDHISGIEHDARFALEKTERFERHQLVTAGELFLHGAAYVWRDDGTVVRPTAEDEEEEERLAAELAARQAEEEQDQFRSITGPVLRPVSLEEVSRTLSYYETVVHADRKPGSCSAELLAVQTQLLSQRESDFRENIIREEKLEFRRVSRAARQHVGAFSQALTSHQRDRVRILAAYHTPREVAAFLTRECQSQEDHGRQLIEVETWHAFGAMRLAISSIMHHMTLAATCHEQARDHIAASRAEALHVVTHRAVSQLQRERFTHWRSVAGRICRRRRVEEVIAARAATIFFDTLRGAYRTWGRWAYTAKLLRLSESGLASHEQLVAEATVTEAEERNRMRIESLEQAGAWAELVEAHFVGLHALRMQEHMARVAYLIRHNDMRLLLDRFVDWHEAYRLRELQRRANWLLVKVGGALVRPFWEHWVKYVTFAVARTRTARALLCERKSAETIVEYQHTEVLARATLERDWADSRHAVYQYAFVVRNALQRHFAALLKQRSGATLTSLAWNRWHRWAYIRRSLILTIELLRTNNLRLMSHAWNSWEVFNFQLQALRREMARMDTEHAQLCDQSVIEAEALITIDSLRLVEDRESYWLLRRAYLTPFRKRVRVEGIWRQRVRPVYSVWKRFAAWRQRWRRRSAIASQLVERNEKRHVAMRFTSWAQPYAPVRDPAAERDRLLLHARTTLAMEEMRARHDVERDFGTSLTAAAQAVQCGVVLQRATDRWEGLLVAEAASTHAARTRSFQKWRDFMERSRKQSIGTAVAARLAAQTDYATRALAFLRWTRRATKTLRQTRIDECQRRNERVLLRRYFRRLTPSLLRQARVSIAKRRLLEARTAAMARNAGADTAPPPESTGPPLAAAPAANSKQTSAVASHSRVLRALRRERRT